MEQPAIEMRKAKGSECEEGKMMGSGWGTLVCLFSISVQMMGSGWDTGHSEMPVQYLSPDVQ